MNTSYASSTAQNGGVRIPRWAWVVALAFFSGMAGAFFAVWAVMPPAQPEFAWQQPPSPVVASPLSGGTSPDAFVTAAAEGSKFVVFIRTVSSRQQTVDPFWNFFNFGHRGPVAGAGSGVIISADGYIVTNNHVVDRAEQITVVLPNKHAYTARVVGTDPNTDLALLKIEATNLPAARIANSDGVRIGEWVLAVGNPLNLARTVTAGIVSAKGRNINIVNSQFPIESFIQTDAAINPGNSGGALVNLRGELIGINTAIKSETGGYMGYGFAIPANIVQKVVKDLIDFGTVQQAFLGAEPVDIDENVARNLGTDDYSGIYVQSVAQGSGADRAGIQPGDVILKIDNVPVESQAEFLERIAYHRPGDRVAVTFRRGTELKTANAQLTNKEGTTDVLRNTAVYVQQLGCDIAPLSMIEKQRMSVDGGWRVSGIRPGPIARLGLQEGFVILGINGQTPTTVEELTNLFLTSRGRVTVEGLDAGGNRIRFQYFTN